MNAVSASNNTEFIQENGHASDSDSNPDDAPQEYYQPISAVDCDDDEVNMSDNEERRDNGYRLHHRLPNGIASVDLNDDGGLEEEQQSGSENEEEEEEERRREESETAIRRAFSEDERRRNAPLTAENAARVMEAMRGVSFDGLAPDWAHAVPEDRWIDRLRRLRQPTPNSSSSTSVQN